MTNAPRPRPPRVPVFTRRDCCLAQREGWNLFNVDTHPEIQRDDEMHAFPSDEAAVAFVKASGSRHGRHALAVIAAFQSGRS